MPDENRQNILTELKRFVRSMHLLAPSRGVGEALSELELDVPNLEKFGHTLFRVFLSERIREKLIADSGALIIRTDDQEIPWELLHNGNEFLCLTRPLGREILTSSTIRKNAFRRSSVPKILLIADPTSNLPGAREEAVKIAGILAANAEIKTLIGPSASASAIFAELARSDWDVVHYAGHARFREDAPDESGLVLSGGQVVSVTEIKRTLAGRPLVVLNACSSGAAKTDSRADHDAGELDQLGLSAAFVMGGALGVVSTLWPVHDRVASTFSIAFYTAILAGRSVGEAVLDAKRVAKGNDPTAVNWASFVYYGNPNAKLDR